MARIEALTYFAQHEAQQYETEANKLLAKLNDWQAYAENESGLKITENHVFTKDSLKQHLVSLAEQDAAKMALKSTGLNILAAAESLAAKLLDKDRKSVV